MDWARILAAFVTGMVDQELLARIEYLATLRGLVSASKHGAVYCCPSRKSYPRVAMMQSGQDWCDHNGPRSLDRSS